MLVGMSQKHMAIGAHNLKAQLNADQGLGFCEGSPEAVSKLLGYMQLEGALPLNSAALTIIPLSSVLSS